MDKTRWGTYQEWKDFGFSVKKGEKATMKCGQPMFSQHQVEKSDTKNSRYRGHTIDYIYYDEWSELDSWALNEVN